MFTPAKQALTALIIAASLLSPISANARVLDQERGIEIMTRGEILSVKAERDTIEFVIKYEKTIFFCTVMDNLNWIDIHCVDHLYGPINQN
jgi:hypothetical protein